MQTKFIDMNNIVSVENMLSSTTYSTQVSERCVYCSNEVESSPYKYKDMTYKPHRCSCETSQLEVTVKEAILEKLQHLEYFNSLIDTEKVFNNLYEYEDLNIKEYQNLNIKEKC